jgi:hypothetical protein
VEAEQPENTEIKMAVKRVFEKSEGNIQKAREGMKFMFTTPENNPPPMVITTDHISTESEQDYANHFGASRDEDYTNTPRGVSSVRVRMTPRPVSGFERESVAVEMGSEFSPRQMAYDEGDWIRPSAQRRVSGPRPAPPRTPGQRRANTVEHLV